MAQAPREFWRRRRRQFRSPHRQRPEERSGCHAAQWISRRVVRGRSRAPVPQSGPQQLRRNPRDRHPASGRRLQRSGPEQRRHALGEEGRGAAIQDGARGAGDGELFRRRDRGGRAGRRRRAPGRTRPHRRGVRAHRRGVRPFGKLHPSVSDGNHALHQHPREHVLLPGHARVSLAKPVVPESRARAPGSAAGTRSPAPTACSAPRPPLPPRRSRRR